MRWLAFVVGSLPVGLAGWLVAALLLVGLSLLVFLPLGVHDPYEPFVLGVYACFQAAVMAWWARRCFRDEGRIPAGAWLWIVALAIAVPVLVHVGARGS